MADLGTKYVGRVTLSRLRDLVGVRPGAQNYDSVQLVAVGQLFQEPLLQTRGFAEWEECFQYMSAKGEKFVLVIDEFPYLIDSNRAIPSLFQKAWDQYLSKSNVFLILLGSSIAMMETEVLGYKSPLYGRRTGQWKVDPMAFDEVSQFREGKSFEDRILHYAVAGGMPAYWLQFSQDKSFASNVKDHALRKGQVLYEEVEFLLREELREPRYYFALLQAVAQGKRKLSEIVNATGLTAPVANKYLGVLIDLSIVEREIPITEAQPLKSKKGLYKISDEFCQFWFQNVFPRKGELEMDLVDLVFKDIEAGLSQYVSIVYEKIAKELLLKHANTFFPFTKIGRWWDKNNEIDIVCLHPDLNKILFCEVKWTSKLVGIDIYEGLKEKARHVMWGNEPRQEHFCLFSKQGFTDAMLEVAKKENVRLFKGEELLSL